MSSTSSLIRDNHSDGTAATRTAATTTAGKTALATTAAAGTTYGAVTSTLSAATAMTAVAAVAAAPADDTEYKTILVGDSGVGKTSLLVQFDQGKFVTGSFSATVGIGFTNKVVDVDGEKVKLQIWDTAGQERFRSVTHAYYRDAHALLLLYDVASKSSFDNIRAWLGEINEYANDRVVIMLLGNKSDMTSERVISSDDGQRLAKEYGVGFMETSAKTGLNVELTFKDIARQLRSSKTNGLASQRNCNIASGSQQQVDTEKKLFGCCSYS